MSDLLPPSAVADRLGVPARTLEQWRYLGKGPKFVRVGRHVRYIPDDVDAWIADQVHEPKPAA